MHIVVKWMTCFIYKSREQKVLTISKELPGSQERLCCQLPLPAWTHNCRRWQAPHCGTFRWNSWGCSEPVIWNVTDGELRPVTCERLHLSCVAKDMVSGYTRRNSGFSFSNNEPLPLKFTSFLLSCYFWFLEKTYLHMYIAWVSFVFTFCFLMQY